MITMTLKLDTPISSFPLVGKIYARRLAKLNVYTVEDLLHHYPHRFEDYSLISPVAAIQPGEVVTVRGQIVSAHNVYTRSGKQLQKALVADKTGQIEITWFNQPFLVKSLTPGIWVSLAGKAEGFLGKLTLISPEYELLKFPVNHSPTIHTGRLVPIYPETAGLSSKWLRSRIAAILTQNYLYQDDWLTPGFKTKYQLLDRGLAIKQIHFPNDLKIAEAARHRLAFEELLLLHLQSLARKQLWQSQPTTTRFDIDKKKVHQFIQRLPFRLTADQNSVIKQILKDLQRPKPMNRLLQGDVGAGKTVVAAAASYVAFLNHQKTAFMVPTSILADQHLKTLKQLLEPYGIKIGFFTSSHKSKLKLKDIDLFLGTHALLYHQLDWQKLGLVIIDEQHRFGVEQRARLLKSKATPHLLTMTATPIPRTVALTLYGDLDLSTMETLPLGRKPVKTWVVPIHKRPAAYEWMAKQINQEHAQVFIVCPLIEESESERLANVKAATAEFTRLKQVFPKHRLALLHGRLKTKDKQRIMEKMTRGDIDILVTTPVVEVGIDIPRANIMLIEAAERFGLSQLHQLRGRVGRSDQQAYCLLFSQLENPFNLRRLQAIQRYHSGLKLAELDLKLRGPGEIYGISQSGFFALKIASFADTELIAQTKQAADHLYSHRQLYPGLQQKLKTITIRDVKPN